MTKRPSGNHSAASRKFRRERLLGRYVANPAVTLLGRLGVRTSFATDLETVGRKTGQRRRVPVSARFDDTGAWVVSAHGMRSGWAHNIVDEPNVLIRQGGRWRMGVATFVPDDDTDARVRTFASSRILAPLFASMFRAVQSDPISVRIDFTD
jgi:deazaflavin-dependent oxidoreductase (nitroreductase family)